MSTSSSSCRIKYILCLSRDQEQEKSRPINILHYLSAQQLHCEILSADFKQLQIQYLGGIPEQARVVGVVAACDWSSSPGSKCRGNILIYVGGGAGVGLEFVSRCGAAHAVTWRHLIGYKVAWERDSASLTQEEHVDSV